MAGSATLAIRSAFETELNGIVPPIAIAWENVEFVPQEGAPFQSVTFLFTSPENPTFGNDYYRQAGIVEIRLQYPADDGPGDAFARAELLRDHFFRGLSLTANGVTTIVERTPEIGSGSNQGGRYVVPVRIHFFAEILN